MIDKAIKYREYILLTGTHEAYIVFHFKLPYVVYRCENSWHFSYPDRTKDLFYPSFYGWKSKRKAIQVLKSKNR